MEDRIIGAHLPQGCQILCHNTFSKQFPTVLNGQLHSAPFRQITVERNGKVMQMAHSVLFVWMLEDALSRLDGLCEELYFLMF